MKARDLAIAVLRAQIRAEETGKPHFVTDLEPRPGVMEIAKNYVGELPESVIDQENYVLPIRTICVVDPDGGVHYFGNGYDWGEIRKECLWTKKEQEGGS
jgi:hypothetical protein